MAGSNTAQGLQVCPCLILSVSHPQTSSTNTLILPTSTLRCWVHTQVSLTCNSNDNYLYTLIFPDCDRKKHSQKLSSNISPNRDTLCPGCRFLPLLGHHCLFPPQELSMAFILAFQFYSYKSLSESW